MFNVTSVFNIVLAKHLELDWEDQDNLDDEFDTYQKMSLSKQKKFDSLVKKAAIIYKSDFESFPKHHRTKLDVKIHDEIQLEISDKLERDFQGFLN
ncbi:hypothetical protein NST69_17875 [Paenibacillus sp. FSL P2-0089]|uniref:hypothetical protein n=1 Tax=Paenibacillus sp. FSL P2-0089 TaxID=2954526 RepID=UPI003159C345